MQKEEFIKAMKEFLAIREDEKNLNVAFKKFEPDFNYISFGRYENLLVRTLEIAMDDTGNWISYFLYDRNCKFTNKKIITDKNGKNIPFKNMNDLYNLIVNK